MRVNFTDVNSWHAQNAIKKAQYIFNKNGDNGLVFGGKANLNRYITGKITKEEYRRARQMSPMVIQGEKRPKGNRFFEFHFEDDYVVYKPSKDRHIPIKFEKLHYKLKEKMSKLQRLADLQLAAITVELTDEFIWFTYEESLLKEVEYENLNCKRVLGIDQNPEFYGISIMEFKDNTDDEPKIIDSFVIDLRCLTKKTGKSSQSKESKHAVNKLKHETIETAYYIDGLVDYYKCGSIALEDLKFKAGSVGTREGNRKCKQIWKRNLFTNKLKALADLHGYKIVEILAVNSSLIGNIVYGGKDCPDMAGAAVEIGRRANSKYVKGHFYPSLNHPQISELWKQKINGLSSWKEVYGMVRKEKETFRISLDECVENAVDSVYNTHSKIYRYRFRKRKDFS